MSTFTSGRRIPIGALGRGVVAGIAGTAAMTAWQELSAQLQESDDSSAGEADESQDPWEQASTPAKVARRVIEGVFQREPPAEWIPVLTHTMHWGYGAAWGVAYALIQRIRRGKPFRGGLAFGTGVWVMSYAQLVPIGLYEPPWKYPARQLALDLSYHLAYGAGLGPAYAALDRH